MKVICAGLQKTGTKTISEALRILGFNVHDVFEQFMLDRDLWYKVIDNTVTKEDFRKYLSHVDAVTDFPGNIYWEQILEAFPDAKVVLSERSTEDEWYRSVKTHVNVQNEFLWSKSIALMTIMARILCPLQYEFGSFAATFMQATLGIPHLLGNPPESIMRSRYRQYNTYVKSACPKDKLLVYNVKEGWKPLCDFLGVDVPSEPFPRRNVKGGLIQELQDGRFDHDCGFRKRANSQFKRRAFVLFAVLTALLVFLIF